MRVNLKHNIAIRIIFISTLVWLIINAIAFEIIKNKTHHFLDESLKETAERILPLALIDIENRETKSLNVELVPLPISDENLSYQIQNKSGRILVRSHRSPIDYQPQYITTGYTNFYGMRMYSSSSEDGEYSIHIFEPIEHRNEITQELYYFFAASLLLLIPLIYWSVYLGLSRFGETIKKYSGQILSLHAQALKPIEISNLPVEINPVGESVNYLINELKSALDKEKNFSENIAHEFRTPIAVAKAQLEVLQIGMRNDESLVRLIKVKKSLELLEHIITKFLQLARAQSISALSIHSVKIDEVVHHTIDTLSEKSSRHYIVDVNHPLENCLANEEILGIMLMNVLENANKYSNQDDPITIILGPGTTIKIQNEHEPLSPEKLQNITQRYTRGDKQFGLGIGLSIVQMLADQINAKFSINSPIQGKTSGVEVLITLMNGSKKILFEKD